jgi:hypothetical protein
VFRSSFSKRLAGIPEEDRKATQGERIANTVDC